MKDKLEGAKETHWLTENLPEWKVRMIVFGAHVKLKINKFISKHQL